jgi:hypothetical protein
MSNKLPSVISERFSVKPTEELLIGVIGVIALGSFYVAAWGELTRGANLFLLLLIGVCASMVFRQVRSQVAAKEARRSDRAEKKVNSFRLMGL